MQPCESAKTANAIVFWGRSVTGIHAYRLLGLPNPFVGSSWKQLLGRGVIIRTWRSSDGTLCLVLGVVWLHRTLGKSLVDLFHSYVSLKLVEGSSEGEVLTST